MMEDLLSVLATLVGRRNLELAVIWVAALSTIPVLLLLG